MAEDDLPPAEDPDNRSRRRALDWLAEKWITDENCPICKDDRWEVQGIAEMSEFSRESLPSSYVFPVVVVMCSNCGYTIFFNSIKAGVTPKADPQESDQQQLDLAEEE